MTNERNRPDTDGTSDASVSRAYADLATERAPARLDATVLQQAARAAERPYKRSVLWTRPVAWAAVVAICLAITLQVTQVPVPEDIPGVMLMESDDRAAAPALDSETGLLEEESGKLEQEQAGDLQLLRQQHAADAPAKEAEALRTTPRTDAARKAQQPAAPLEAALQESTSPVPETFEMQDADMLQRAEDMARQRAGENREAEYAARGVSSFAPASVAASVDTDGCSEQDREHPQDWLVCILRLEHAGRNEEAATEREQLAAAFPDFEVPATSE